MAGLSSLKELNLGYNPVTNEGLKHLGNLKNLRSLWLYFTRIDDRWSDYLGTLPSLESLVMWGTQLSDSGTEGFADFPSLRYLDIAETRMTSDGVSKLRAMLPECRIRWYPPESVAVSAPDPAADVDRSCRWLRIAGEVSGTQELRISAAGIEAIRIGDESEWSVVEVNGRVWDPSEEHLLANDAETRLLPQGIDFQGAEVYLDKLGVASLTCLYEEDSLRIGIFAPPNETAEIALFIKLPTLAAPKRFSRDPNWITPW